MSDNDPIVEEGVRRLDVESRKMQAALISQEIAKVIDGLPQMSIKDMRDAIRRFIPIGPPKNITQMEDQADSNILNAVLDRFEEKPWLCFVYRPAGTKEVKRMKVKAEARDSSYLVGLLRRILSDNYKRYLAERDTIGLEAYSLEGRKKQDTAHVTSLRDILRRGSAK